MKIYEMIFHKGTYEKTNLFYKVNNKCSRQHFIEQIRLELDIELDHFQRTCISEHKNDLLSLFKEVHQESYHHIDTMVSFEGLTSLTCSLKTRYYQIFSNNYFY